MTKAKGSTAINFADQTLHLLPDRAVWWPRCSTLIIADAHLGKSASFRKTGVPVPSGATAKDLGRLTTLLHETGAERLVILGDFLHSRAGCQDEQMEAIASWRGSHPSLAILLVRGNHDRSAGRIPPAWGFDEVEEPHLDDGVALAHDPRCPCTGPVLAGHVHPVVALQDYDRSAVSFPCFVTDPDCCILPAFGTFTGGYKMRRQAGRRIFVVAAGRIIPLPDDH